MSPLKIGIIGVGNMGITYVHQLDQGKIAGAKLTAICELSEARINQLKEDTSGDIAFYQDEDVFLREADIDAVIVATPHHFHPKTAIKAFEKNLHVLIEKPAGVFTKDVLKMNKVAEASGKVFGIMYNQRTDPMYQKVRELIQEGELGEIKRTNWIITDWYRPESYYKSSDWRATWAGEGGGVLLNQAPHQLDLWQWTTGLMPKKVHGFCGIGKYHDIEVEDDVTAYVEYENGATGVFITSTGEAPGTNRFEIVGDRGKLIVENGKLTFYRLTVSEREFNKNATGLFSTPECWEIKIPTRSGATHHVGILQNWVDAIVKGSPLLAPGVEGVKGLEISNAIYLSSWLGQAVQIPVDADLFYEKLQEKMTESAKKKQLVASANDQ